MTCFTKTLDLSRMSSQYLSKSKKSRKLRKQENHNLIKFLIPMDRFNNLFIKMMKLMKMTT